MSREFPDLTVLVSDQLVGPGGGRNRMMAAASHRIVASFDDDSYPIDRDYFARVRRAFEQFPDAWVVDSRVFHLNQAIEPDTATSTWVADFSGGGCAYRRERYLQTGGYVPLPTAYGMEEVDFGLRLHARGGRVLRSGSLRVFHHTDLSHHADPAITSASIVNVALLTYLRYPLSMWAVGAAQCANRIQWLLRHGRRRGVWRGLVAIPSAIAAASPRTRSAAATRGAIVSVAEARTTSGVSARRINFGNLDALRGLLAVYVALGHCRWLLWGGHAAWLATPHTAWEAIPVYASGVLRYGREAVMVFFALSGFFIHFRAADAPGRQQFRAAPFYRRRWHRLAPPYFFALVVTLACDLIGRTWWPTLYEARTGDSLLDATFASGGYSQTSVVPAVLLLPSTLGRDFGSNGPLWSIAFEAVYYAIYPLVAVGSPSQRGSRVRRDSAGVPVAGVQSRRRVPGAGADVLPDLAVGALLAERMVIGGVPQRAVGDRRGHVRGGGGALCSRDLPPLVAVIASLMFGAGLVLARSAARRLAIAC